MRSVLVDKIASVALQADLGQEIRVADEIPCEEGVLIAVEVLNNKSRYNTLELTSGRGLPADPGQARPHGRGQER